MKKNNTKGFSIIFAPEDSSRSVRIKIGGRIAKLAGLILGVFILLNIAVLAWNIVMINNNIEPIRLKKAKRQLISEVSIIRDRLDSLKTASKSVTNQTEHLYALADINKPPKEFAVGGPQLKDFSEPRLNNIAFEIDSLLFVLENEFHALKETEEYIQKNKKILRHTPSIIPMHGYITSGFGRRLDPITGKWAFHEGLDIVATKGTPIHASADGRVKFTGTMGGFGRVVIIDHIWYETRYGHLDEILVAKGKKISRGDKVGTCGRSGRTTGIHLHYEVRVAGKPINPMNFILPERFVVD